MEGGYPSNHNSTSDEPGTPQLPSVTEDDDDMVSDTRASMDDAPKPAGRSECPATPPTGPLMVTPRTPLTPIATTPRPGRIAAHNSLPMHSYQPSPTPPRILMMPRRSEPQLPQFHLPQTRGRASTSAYHLRRPSVDTRPRLAPLKSKARPSEKEKIENEVLPDEIVDHMFAMTPRSTSSSVGGNNEFQQDQSPIAVIEEPGRHVDTEYKLDLVVTIANYLGIAVFIDMMLKLVMFLVFMSYIDPIRMVFSIFGYSSSFSFSIRQYFMYITFCAFDILLLIVWGWDGFGDKQMYRTILGVTNLVIIVRLPLATQVMEMLATGKLLLLIRSLTPEQFQELHDR
ncbi:unnamed protein product [Aphanomyces euteiches]